MSPLERRCRLLMFTYPAEYRRERGDEMVGTLLDTTPPGRTWPRPGDIWALVIGGLRSRSVRSRRLGMATNLRLAALFGVAIYLSVVANGSIVWGLTPYTAGWPYWLMGLLIAVTILAAWFARRTVVLVAALVAATFCYEEPTLVFRLTPSLYVPNLAEALLLVLLAALVLLSGGRKRPPRLWLCLPGLAIAAALLSRLLVPAANWFPSTSTFPEGQTTLLAVVLVMFLAFVVIDPRPALALAIYFGLFLANQVIMTLMLKTPPHGAGLSLGELDWVWLWPGLVLAVLALLLVRRRPRAVL